jgi:hypothetical protein
MASDELEDVVIPGPEKFSEFPIFLHGLVGCPHTVFGRIGKIGCRCAAVPSVSPLPAVADEEIYVASDVCTLECSRILPLNGLAGLGFGAHPGTLLP